MYDIPRQGKIRKLFPSFTRTDPVSDMTCCWHRCENKYGNLADKSIHICGRNGQIVTFLINPIKLESVRRKWPHLTCYLHAHVSSFETVFPLVGLSFSASVSGCASLIRHVFLKTCYQCLLCKYRTDHCWRRNFEAIGCTVHVHYVGSHDLCISQCIHYARLQTAVRKELFSGAYFPIIKARRGSTCYWRWLRECNDTVILHEEEISVFMSNDCHAFEFVWTSYVSVDR